MLNTLHFKRSKCDTAVPLLICAALIFTHARLPLLYRDVAHVTKHTAQSYALPRLTKAYVFRHHHSERVREKLKATMWSCSLSIILCNLTIAEQEERSTFYFYEILSLVIFAIMPLCIC